MSDSDAFGLSKRVGAVDSEVKNQINCSHWVLPTKPDKSQVHKAKKIQTN